MSGAEIIAEMEDYSPRPRCMALIAVYSGLPMLLASSGDGLADEAHDDLHGWDVGDKLANDGIYIAHLGWSDGGPCDWDPTEREQRPALAEVRLATVGEWKAHVGGEYPWFPDEQDDTPLRSDENAHADAVLAYLQEQAERVARQDYLERPF